MGAAEWTGYSSPTVASSYPTTFQTSAYDQSSMLPAVLPNDGITYNPNDYHCTSTGAQNAATYGSSQFTSLSPWTNEVDQYNYGYNSYQPYPCQSAQPQYPAPAPPVPAQTTMVLYPQLYSTVNQNQIHLHLHGSDKLVEQYLGNATTPMQSNDSFPLASSGVISNSSQRAISGLELPILSNPDDIKNQEQTVDQDVNDQNVWRPY